MLRSLAHQDEGHSILDGCYGALELCRCGTIALPFLRAFPGIDVGRV